MDASALLNGAASEATSLAVEIDGVLGGASRRADVEMLQGLAQFSAQSARAATALQNAAMHLREAQQQLHRAGPRPR